MDNNHIPADYPNAADDASGLRVDIGHQDGKVIIQFSKPVTQMIMPPHMIRSMAIALLQNAEVALMQPGPTPLPPSRQ